MPSISTKKENFRNTVKYLLKNSKIVRALCKPYKDAERKREHERYLLSDDHKRLAGFHNSHLGERCFIIGNGPSLTTEDLEKLRGECTFAANRIYEIFDKTDWRPTFYIAIDPDFLDLEWKHLNKYDMENMFLAIREQQTTSFPKERTIRIFEYAKFRINKWNDRTAVVSEDVSDFFSIGYTVTFTAIQLAIYMGFKEIYLLGVDFNYSVVRDKRGKVIRNDSVKDYFSGKKYATTVLNYQSALHSDQVARAYCDAHGITIRNATRGGKLEVFERESLDEVLDAPLNMNSVDSKT